MDGACKIQGDRARELKLNVKKIHKFQQVCAWILCYKRYEVEVMVWSLTVELDSDPLDQASTYIGKKTVKICGVLTSSLRCGHHPPPQQWHDTAGYVYIHCSGISAAGFCLGFGIWSAPASTFFERKSIFQEE